MKSFQHQIDANQKAKDQEYFAYLMEMGTGKSRCVLQDAEHLFNTGKINAALIIAPKSIGKTWAVEQIPTHFDGKRIIAIWGSTSKKLERELQNLYKIGNHLRFFIVNIEIIAGYRCYDEVEKFLKQHQAMMIVDESTTIKNFKALRTKAICKLGKLAKYRRILTGTPITQSPLDLYSQFDFLKPGCLGSTSYYGFRNQYSVLRKRYVNGRNFMEVTGYQRLQQLQDKIRPISFRALKKDCLDLPDKIYEVRHIALSPKQYSYYKQMEKEALAILQDGTVVTAPLVITQLLRLQQSLCNIVPSGIDAEFKNIDDENPRIDEIISILLEAGDQKVIIWANFINSINQITSAIKKELKKDSGEIHGVISAENRQKYVERFQNGDLQYIVAQPRTGGYGLTLTAATIVIYHDHNWSLEVRQQSEDRAHRIGQNKNVTYIDLVATGTIDEQIRNALVAKKDVADLVNGDKISFGNKEIVKFLLEKELQKETIC